MRIACAIAASALVALAGAAEAQPAQPSGTIEVIGHATTAVSPDHALVQVGVSTKGQTPSAALDDNSASAGRIIRAMREAGIPEADLRTSTVSLSPAFKQVRDPAGGTQQQPDGYQAENQVEIRVRDLGKLGDFIRRTLDGGANRISGLSFGVTDDRAALDAVRREAVADAVRQARLLADAAGVKLGAVRRIGFSPRANPPGPLYGTVMRAAAAPVPVQAGSLDVSADVAMTWAIEQP